MFLKIPGPCDTNIPFQRSYTWNSPDKSFGYEPGLPCHLGTWSSVLLIGELIHQGISINEGFFPTWMVSNLTSSNVNLEQWQPKNVICCYILSMKLWLPNWDPYSASSCYKILQTFTNPTISKSLDNKNIKTNSSCINKQHHHHEVVTSHMVNSFTFTKVLSARPRQATGIGISDRFLMKMGISNWDGGPRRFYAVNYIRC